MTRKHHVDLNFPTNIFLFFFFYVSVSLPSFILHPIYLSIYQIYSFEHPSNNVFVREKIWNNLHLFLFYGIFTYYLNVVLLKTDVTSYHQHQKSMVRSEYWYFPMNDAMNEEFSTPPVPDTDGSPRVVVTGPSGSSDTMRFTRYILHAHGTYMGMYTYWMIIYSGPNEPIYLF